MTKFLFVYRNPVQTERTPPSAAEMQAMLAQWQQWKTAFPTAIVDLGDALLPTGHAIKGGVVTDGPTIESKEMISGYSIVEAADYEAALVIAKACPILFMPGASIEVRQLAGY